MRATHLHPFYRYFPNTFIEITLFPFSLAEFDGANLGQHQNSSRQSGYRATRIRGKNLQEIRELISQQMGIMDRFGRR
ncbi:Uncharacterised protein [Serratia quinivorans]|nr:Uncharacterised protein [Serratia quinivorans]